jgi:hypothetical protein
LRLTRWGAAGKSGTVTRSISFIFRIVRGSCARVLAVASTVFVLAGCGGGLQVARVKSDQQKPNNVWVFFSVQKGKEPVPPIAAGDFEIYEDGQLVSKFESKQTIQNPEVAAVMYTLLLLDMSGSVTESGQAGQLVDAAKQFSDRVGKTQKVGVYAFDGSEKIHPVVPFTETPGSVAGGLEGLRTFKPKDPSTNLNGAVIQGLETLKKALESDRRPLKFGTLVVFTDGTDRAARVPHKDVVEEIKKKDYETYEIFGIGVGAELDKSELSDYGRDGTELATDRAKVTEAFDKVAGRIEAHTHRFYLLSYCTPSRNGDHKVRIVAKSKEGSGSLEYGFSASGFGPPPDCDPERKPAFTLDVDGPGAETAPPESGASDVAKKKK